MVAIIEKRGIVAFNYHIVCEYTNEQHFTIIDFNEVDIRIYLPEKVIIHRGR